MKVSDFSWLQSHKYCDYYYGLWPRLVIEEKSKLHLVGEEKKDVILFKVFWEGLIK